MSETIVNMMGQVYMLAGPSGSGKDTLIRAVKSKHPCGETKSFTTKPDDGVGKYHHTDVNNFNRLAESGFFAEYAMVHGHWYGTPLNELLRLSSLKQDSIFDLDIQGAKQLKDRFPSFHLIFIVPPSIAELRERIVTRNRGESEAQIDVRVQNAVNEMRQAEIADWFIENDNLDQAISFLSNLVLHLSRGEKPSFVRYRNTHLVRKCLNASWN